MSSKAVTTAKDTAGFRATPAADADTAKSAAFYEDMRQTAKAHELPTKVMQGGMVPGEDERPAPPLKYNFQQEGIERTKEKAALASRLHGAQWTVTDKDVDRLKQEAKDAETVEYDKWLLRHVPVDKPGGLEMLKKASPDTYKRMAEAQERKWQTLQMVERLQQFSPTTPDEYKMRYLLEKGPEGPLGWALKSVRNLYTENNGQFGGEDPDKAIAPRTWMNERTMLLRASFRHMLGGENPRDIGTATSAISAANENLKTLTADRSTTKNLPQSLTEPVATRLFG